MSSRSFGFEGMWGRRLGQGYLKKCHGSLPYTAEMNSCRHNTEFTIGSGQTFVSHLMEKSIRNGGIIRWP